MPLLTAKSDPGGCIIRPSHFLLYDFFLVVAKCCGEMFAIVANRLICCELLWRNVWVCGEVLGVWRSIVAKYFGLWGNVWFVTKCFRLWRIVGFVMKCCGEPLGGVAKC